MPHALRIADIRQRVSETFAHMQVPQPDQFRESILLRGGAYCGRRFEADGAYAIWFLEEDEVKFYVAAPDVARLPMPAARRLAA
jgi:hypothetical protein